MNSLPQFAMHADYVAYGKAVINSVIPECSNLRTLQYYTKDAGKYPAKLQPVSQPVSGLMSTG